MTPDDEFASCLIGLGLSEKEAKTYLHLLRYGPMAPSPLAKSLKTYRVSVHRTLTGLLAKGLVNPTVHSPLVYAAVNLDTALDAAVKRQENKLRETEARRQELQELCESQRSWPSDEVSTFQIIKSIKELIAIMQPVITSMKQEWVMAVPDSAAIIASRFGILEPAYEFINRGGRVRVIINGLSHPAVKIVQDMMDNGEEVRCLNQESIMFTIFDKKTCISAVRAEITQFSLHHPIVAICTDDQVYSRYLMSIFEMLWERSVPAEEQIQELLEQDRPRNLA